MDLSGVIRPVFVHEHWGNLLDPSFVAVCRSEIAGVELAKALARRCGAEVSYVVTSSADGKQFIWTRAAVEKWDAENRP